MGVTAVLIVLIHWLWSMLGKAGAMLFVLFPERGKPDDTVEFFAGIHEFIANFVWAYWGGHIAMAFMHKRAGHPNVRDMFTLKP